MILSLTVTEDEFRTWEERQVLRFGLVAGRPVRLADENQSQSRLARVRQIALRVLANQEAVLAWMTNPSALLGGFEPEVAAAESEEGCQLVLRTLIVMVRRREAAFD